MSQSSAYQNPTFPLDESSAGFISSFSESSNNGVSSESLSSPYSPWTLLVRVDALRLAGLSLDSQRAHYVEELAGQLDHLAFAYSTRKHCSALARRLTHQDATRSGCLPRAARNRRRAGLVL